MNFANLRPRPSELLLLAVCALIMWTTRSDHFGSAISLPDASLALFFIAGFYSRKLAIFVALCALAAFSDYWAITHRSVSSYCVTAGYGFLLPTYYVMWWAGRWAALQPLLRASDWLLLTSLALLATTAAFTISSGSFYLLAPYFTDHSLGEFARRTALYYPRYAGYTLGYLVLAFALHASWSLALGERKKQHG